MIPAYWRASAGFLLRHPWQLGLAVLGIAIGVAVIVAVDLANASARKAFLLSMDTIAGEATHQVIGGPGGVPESVYVDLRTKHGYTGIAPVVEGEVEIDQRSFRLLGIDLFAEGGVRTFTGEAATATGETRDEQSLFRDFLTVPGAVTMSAAAAESLRLDVGGRFDVGAAGRRRPAMLAGVFTGDEAGLADLVIADIATAQNWLDMQGFLSRIDVRIEAGDTGLEARLGNALPGGTTLLSAAGRTRATADLSAAFMTNLSAMSLLALLVGLFLIYNSVSFSVLQRRGLFGVLRALGVTRAGVLGVVLAEALTIGLAAAVVGLLLGTWLGEGLLSLVTRSINDLYFRVSVSDVMVDPLSVAKGLLAGIGASLAAAAVPALEATSCQPRLSMTRSTLEHRARSLLPSVAVAGLVLMAAAIATLLLSGRSLVAGLTAVFMLILGFALCIPWAVRHVTTALAPLAQSLGRTPARLAVAGIAASLSRTGVAVVALAVAVSATIGVSVMVDSFRGSVSDWLGQALQADIYAGVEQGAFDPQLIDEIAALPDVVEYSTSRRAWLEDEDGRIQLIAIDMASGSYAGTDILDADPDVVWPAWERDDVVLASEPYAYQHGVSRGDAITLRTASGPVPFELIATYQSYDINASALLISRSTYDRHFADDGIDSIGLYLAEGSDVAKTIDRIDALTRERQVIRTRSNAQLLDLSLDIFDRTFVITDVLYWLASGVALIGILGAMLALQLEKGREQGVLRALGMTPAQLGGLITLQTGVIGLLSGIAAIPLGIVMAWVLIEVINRRAFGWQIDMAVAPDILASAVAFAVVAALVAGIYPAWRAAQSQPAVAMREE